MERPKKLSLAISKIFEIAQKNNWVVEYDANLDHFYWAKPKISKNARLKKFLDDFSLYITPSGKIEGIFIEYAKYNFLEHNKEYKVIIQEMKKVKGKHYVLEGRKEKKVEGLLKGMANQISNETLEVIGKGLKLEEVAK